jgi:hypothetical protein
MDGVSHRDGVELHHPACPGDPDRVHWSWLLIFAIFVWSLAKLLFPATYPGLDGSTYLAMAVATALLFFAGVLGGDGHRAVVVDDDGRVAGLLYTRPTW